MRNLSKAERLEYQERTLQNRIELSGGSRWDYKGVLNGVNYDYKDRPAVIMFDGSSTKPKHIVFRNEEQRGEWIENYKENHDKHEAYKQSVRDARKTKPVIEVGQLFRRSWGYDQTNVNYYKIVEKLSDHYAMMVEVAYDHIEGSQGMMCCDVTPDPDREIGKTFRAKINARRGENGKLYVRINDWDYAYECEHNDVTYKSWYA